jgi:L-threonine-O-3-phosphate decarboxylase
MRKLPPSFPRPAGLFRHGGARAGRGPVLDFSASINPLGPPAGVLAALRRALASVAHYPDPACTELRERLAARHGVGRDQVVVGNGSSELIHALPRALRARRCAIAEPAYTEYLRASLAAGADADHWLAEGDDFTPGPFDPDGADLVWLGNPNNPTGQLWERDALLRWIGSHPGVVFAVDEAFLPFLPDDAGLSLVAEVERFPNLVVLRSLTKLYSLPGVRLGYAVTNRELARRLRVQLVPWSVNVFAQEAGLAALDDEAFLRQTRAWAGTESPYLQSRLGRLLRNARPVPSSAIFVLMRLEGEHSARLTAALQERDILIRDAANFVGLDGRYVRVALRSRADNQRLVRALFGFLGTGADLDELGG